MRLVLMRHAAAEDADPRRWPDDRERPLTDAGRREHARVAEVLRRMGLRFDRILTSRLRRARETADITARILDEAPAPEPADWLGDRAEVETVLVRLTSLRAESLLCVGHEPTLSRLIAVLTSRDGSAQVEMETSGVAIVECPDPPEPGHGALRMHWHPADLARLLDEPVASARVDTPAPPSPDAFMGAITAYQRSAALKGALDLDLFTAIGDRQEIAATLAERCGASPRGLRILCDYLTVAGFLTKAGDRYGLTADSARFLDRRSPACVAPAADFVYAPDLREAFGDVAAAVRRGGTVLASAGTVAPEHPLWVRFARAMAPLMSVTAEAVVDLVPVDPARPLRVLDVAAGHGLFGIALGRRHPRAVITALDWAPVLEVARENARAAGLDRRFRTIAGSAFEADLDGPYDLILVPNFLHHFDPSTCERFLARAREALAPAGRAVAVEFVPDEGRVTPPHAAMFSLVMLCSTPAGDAYTFSELDAMFRRAGFGRSELRTSGPGGPQVIISAR